MKKRIFALLFATMTLISACNYNGGTSITRTISRHYTMKQGHASLNSDDYGESEYFTIDKSGVIKKTQQCNFDSFNYCETEDSSEFKHHKGIGDYITTDEDKTFFNFHYDGNCEYKITSPDNKILLENKGTYRFLDDDNISINFEDGTTGSAITRFGLEHAGLGQDKITFLQTPLLLDIDGKPTTIYFWFYDTILHPSPWGEE